MVWCPNRASNSSFQVLLDSGLLHVLRDLFGHANADVTARACWILSNIAAGTRLQRRAMIEYSDLMTVLVLEGYHVSALVRQEVTMAFCNLVKYGNDHVRREVVKIGGLTTLCVIFRNPESDFEVLKVR